MSKLPFFYLTLLILFAVLFSSTNIAASEKILSIDNGLSKDSSGYMKAGLTSAADVYHLQLNGQLPSGVTENSLPISYETYIDWGEGAVSLADFVSGVERGEDAQLISFGQFTGVNGNIIDWQVNSWISAGAMTLNSSFNFSAQTGSIGKLRLYRVFKPNRNEAVEQMHFSQYGSVENNSLELIHSDLTNNFAISSSGALMDSNGLKDARFSGWVVCDRDSIEWNLSNKVLDLNTDGDICFDASAEHPVLGSLYNADDMVSLMSWEIDAKSADAEVLTRLHGISDIQAIDTQQLDLTVSDLQKIEPVGEQPGLLQAYLYNNSYSDVLQPITVSFYMGDSLQSRQLVGVSTIKKLNALSKILVSTEWAGRAEGLYSYAVVDVDNDVREVDERNNVSKLAFKQTFKPFEVVLDADAAEYETTSVIRLSATFTNPRVDSTSIAYFTSIYNEEGKRVEYYPTKLLMFTSGVSSQTIDFIWNTGILDAGNYKVTMALYSLASIKLFEATRNITLVSVGENTAPIAEDDTAMTTMSSAVEIDLLQNDRDVDGNLLFTYITEQPKHGIVEENRGQVIYTPEEGFVGIDHFKYQLDDNSGGSDWAQVSIQVLPLELGCTWVRDYQTVHDAGKISDRGWSIHPDQEASDPKLHASLISNNDNPGLFVKQPLISYPSCSLYYQAKVGKSGTAIVTYNVLDRATNGQEYRSEPRTFSIEISNGFAVPIIASVPSTLIEAGQQYNYQEQLLSGEVVSLIPLELPDWLSIEGDLIVGQPGSADIGIHRVSLTVVNEENNNSTHTFIISVTPPLAVDNNSTEVADDDASGNAENGKKPIEPIESLGIATGVSGAGSAGWIVLMFMLLVLLMRKEVNQVVVQSVHRVLF